MSLVGELNDFSGLFWICVSPGPVNVLSYYSPNKQLFFNVILSLRVSSLPLLEALAVY